VNSISLKEGREAFIEKAELVRRYGAAVVVMASTSRARPTLMSARWPSAQKRTASSRRSGLPAAGRTFDPNIFAVATGIDEHNTYAMAYLKARPGHQGRRCRTHW